MSKKDSKNVVQSILDKTEEEIQKMDPVNILVAGKTGVGKSTLINNMFREQLVDTGVGKPITKHLRKITKDGMPLALYDTRGLELEERVQKRVKNEIFDLIEKNKNSKDEIHVVYYCVNANSSRIEDAEVRFINELAGEIPVILVLTQSMGEPTKAFQSYLENQNLEVVHIQRVMAQDLEISPEVTIEQYGLKELIELSFNLIPEGAHDAFLNAQQADIERKAKTARRWANRYVATTFGVGFSPIPFSDASVLVPMQVGLLAHITAIFGISLEKSSLVSIIAAVGGTGGATLAGKSVVSNAFKFIPGVGTVIGGVISGTTASVITSALAYSYIEVLTIISLSDKEGAEVSPQKIKRLMKERYKNHLIGQKDKVDDEKLEFKEDSSISKREKIKKATLSSARRFINRFNRSQK